MQDDEHDELYIGYLPQAPRHVGRFVRLAATLLLVAAAAVAGLLAWLQEPFDGGRFEFGTERSFAGLLAEKPYPLLQATSRDSSRGAIETLLLSNPGKHGAAAPGLDGRSVMLRGALVEGEDRSMIALARDGVAITDAPFGVLAFPEPQPLGRLSLVGEIVDSKCYLGVMKPGRGRPHRGCATRCLSGGIPPLFVVETEAGERTTLLLVDKAGQPLGDRLLGFVAEPIAVDGTLERRGDLLVLAVDLDSLRPASR